MGKIYYMVSKDDNKIIAMRNIGKIGQSIYNESPKERPSYIREKSTTAVGLLGILLSIANSIPFLHLETPPILALGLAAAFAMLAFFEFLHIKSASGASDKKKKRHLHNGYVPSVGPWLDPYGIARDAADVPGKKTYYIVDGGKNAIVDVKRLGKWGQRYVAWRGKRQKQKTE